MNEYDTLVISGGSIRGICALGALYYCEIKGWLENIHTYVGTSIGAIINYLLIIGFTPLEIIHKLCSTNFIEDLNSPNLANLIYGKGIFSYDVISKYLEIFTLEKIGSFLTMKELEHRYKKKLVCVTYNMTQQRVEYITGETHPDIPCIIALRMSSNIPFLFDDFKYNKCQYIDGGFYDNFPVLYNTKWDSKTLAISLIPKESVNPNKYEDPNSSRSVIKRLTDMINIPINRLYTETLQKKAESVDVIDIGECNLFMWDLKLTVPQRFDIFSTGFKTAKQRFEKNDL